MTGFLVPINKSIAGKTAAAAATGAAAKVAQTTRGKVTQAKIQGAVKDALKTAEEHAAKPHVPPGTPANKISERAMRLADPRLIAGGTGALIATGAGVGAYKYKKRRVEKSLSLMQHDLASVMMSTT